MSQVFDVVSIFNKVKQLDFFKVIGTEVSMPEFITLNLIDNVSKSKANGVVWVSDIVERTNVTAQMVSKVLRTLENKGYIQRFADTADRRRTEVVMCEAGRAAYDYYNKKYQSLMDSIAGGFKSDEYSELKRLLKKFESLYVSSVQKLMEK